MTFFPGIHPFALLYRRRSGDPWTTLFSTGNIHMIELFLRYVGLVGVPGDFRIRKAPETSEGTPSRGQAG